MKSAGESIHLYYAQALAYLSRLPAGIFPPRGRSRQYFRLPGKKRSRLAAQRKDEGERNQRGERSKRETMRQIFTPHHLAMTPVLGMTRSSFPRYLLRFSVSLLHTLISTRSRNLEPIFVFHVPSVEGSS